MSRNEWERGEIKMSVKEFGSVRRDVVAFVNSRQSSLFEHAKAVYAALKVAGKGQRKFDFHTAYDAAIQPRKVYRDAPDTDGYHEIFHALFPYEEITPGMFGVSRKPKAPKKNQFAPVKQNVERIELGEASIGFDKKRRVILWSTGENNHAVERAHDHAVAKTLFSRLERVVWTRGTGGELIGNDEYNEDAGREYAGGGGSYVTRRFGVAEKNFKKSFGRIR